MELKPLHITGHLPDAYQVAPCRHTHTGHPPPGSQLTFPLQKGQGCVRVSYSYFGGEKGRKPSSGPVAGHEGERPSVSLSSPAPFP